MSSVVVVLDACVLFPASLRDILLRTAQAGFFRFQWTEEILEEVRRNLVKKTVTEEQAAKLIKQMKLIFPDAMLSEDKYQALVAQMQNDPKDRHVLAAAVASKAPIVTSNLKDFPKSILNPLGVEAYSPDTFLINLFDQNLELLVPIIQKQAEDLKNPPYTFEQLLQTLEKHIPQTVAAIRQI